MGTCVDCGFSHDSNRVILRNSCTDYQACRNRLAEQKDEALGKCLEHLATIVGLESQLSELREQLEVERMGDYCSTTWLPIENLPEKGESGDLLAIIDNHGRADVAVYIDDDWEISGLEGVWAFPEGHEYVRWKYIGSLRTVLGGDS